MRGGQRSQHARMCAAVVPERQQKQFQIDGRATCEHGLRAGDNRTGAIHDGQEDGGDIGVVGPPEIEKGTSLEIPRPQGIDTRAAQPQRKQTVTIGLDHESIGKDRAYRGRIDFGSIGRRSLTAQPVPIRIEFPRRLLSHFSSRPA